MNGSNRSKASRNESGPPVSLPGQARHSDAGMSAVGADVPAVVKVNSKAPGSAVEEDEKKGVVWSDQQGRDLTMVREFEPRCVPPPPLTSYSSPCSGQPD